MTSAASDLSSYSGSASASPPAPRWPLLDLARWPAIYAIVWLHAFDKRPTLTSLTRFAVPFFVAAVAFLVVQGVCRKPQRSFVQYASGRFLRIYVPFLAWSAVYLGFKVVKAHFLPEQRNDFHWVEMLWTGSFYHLWFMPFILVVSLAVFLIARLAYGCRLLLWPIAIGSLAAGLALGVPALAAAVTPSQHPFDYMIDALPAALWGVTAGLAFSCAPPSRTFSIVSMLVCAASMLGIAVFDRSTLLENLAGVSLLLAALYPTQSPALLRIARLPALAYGIYFAHMLAIKICESLAARQGLSMTWQLDCGIFLAAAVSATLLAWLLYPSRWTRWLVS